MLLNYLGFEKATLQNETLQLLLEAALLDLLQLCSPLIYL